MARCVAIPLAACCVLAGLSVNRAAAQVPSGYHLAFDEEFNGTSLSNTQFNYTWTGYPGVYSTTAAVAVNNGLTLTTYSTGSGSSLTNWGGCVSTMDTYSYAYGYTEAAIKFNNSIGNDMAFCLYASQMFAQPPPTSASVGNEVDVIEETSLHPTLDYMNIHWDGYGSGSQSMGSTARSVPNLQGNYNIFGLLWTRRYVFSVNGTNCV